MMNFEEALTITDTLVFEKTGKHLNDAQRAVIQGTWYCQKYHEIALEYRCTPEYLKQDVGPKLWKLLSDELGEKVTKKNFRTVIERRTLEEEGERGSTGAGEQGEQGKQGSRGVRGGQGHRETTGGGKTHPSSTVNISPCRLGGSNGCVSVLWQN
ncbi:hypothetical protein [Planktothrix tepida]|uniref:hypothetical protein n=1 Tax=Planktothrix tepida TaxID=1678309 RepID=UPI0020B1861A|nr:hypothetical protein [Planktothrix tepida]